MDRKKNKGANSSSFPVRALCLLICVMLVLPGCVPATQRPVEAFVKSTAALSTGSTGPSGPPVQVPSAQVPTVHVLRAFAAPQPAPSADALMDRPSASRLASRPSLASLPSLPPHQSASMQSTLFNATASFLGLPGLAPAYGTDGLRDEGRGFHADGTTRKAAQADAASFAHRSEIFDGRRAATGSYADSYAAPYSSGPYAKLMGFQRDRNGQLQGMGSKYAGLRNGRQSVSSHFGDNMFDSLLQRGISAGMGFANSAVESSILGLMGKDSPYGNGKARLNFYLNLDQKGELRLQGEGDILWPLYDTLYTSIYTQLGARSQLAGSGGGENHGTDRWIANLGLGQRWFPSASVNEDGSINSGNWMLGYNAFFDYDITRGHQRGGFGAELQYDWLKLASNYYLPLSTWKDSKDFDGHYVQERAAEGWDLRVKGYLPFYRAIAVTGSFTQWYGDRVGMFGPSKLERDPKIWSYGVEYTPAPAITAYVNQRQTEQGRSDTQLGLRFTYNFGMDAEEQFKPSRVAQMRTVHGARHDFVDRENKIILEYQAKNRFRVDFLGFDGANTFSFRLRNGFDQNAAGQTVRVTVGGPVTVAETSVNTFVNTSGAKQSFFAQAMDVLGALVSVRAAHADSGMSYTTDAEGIIRIHVDNPGKLNSLNISAGESSMGFTRDSMGLGPKLVADMQSGKPEVDANGKTTIHIKDAAYNADVQWKVEAIAPSSASGSISGGNKTNDNGEVTATFTATAPGAVNIIATVGGETIICQVTVKDNSYTITASTADLTQLTLQDVIFTVKKNDAAVGSGISLSVAAKTELGINSQQDKTTDASGQFTLTLKPTGTATSPQTLAFTIDNKSITKDFTVSTLSLTLTPAAMEIFAGESTTVTLGNAPVGAVVEWSVTTNGELSGQQTIVQASGTTTATLKAKNDASGAIKVTAKVGGTNGISTNCTVTAKENTYTIEADSTTLTQITPQDVTFTVKKNGSVVGSGLSVSVAAKTELGVTTSTPSTDNNGQFTLTLKPTGTATSPQTLAFTIDNKSITKDFTVSTLNLTLAPAATEIFEGASTTVTLGNAPVGEQVAWSVTNSGELSSQETIVQAGGTATATLKAKDAASGAITVTATVGGASGISTDCTVTAKENTYTIEASPTALTQLTPASVTFTVKRNGTALRDTSVTFTSNANFTNLPTDEQKTNGSGQITVSGLTATASGAQAVEITVEGQQATATFIVTPAIFSYNLSNLTVDGSGNLGGSIAVAVSGSSNPVPNVYVNVPLKYRTAGGISSPGTLETKELTINGTTDASGNLAAIGNVTALARKIDFSADTFATTKELTVGTVPSGFLTGQSVSTMDWANAKSYCEEHGGKIPRTNGSDSWDGSGLSSIDGFGTGAWPSALPNGYYWTGTELSNYTDYAWIVDGYGGIVGVNFDFKSNDNRLAACVP